MQQLIIASNNQGKILEIKKLIDCIELLSLHDIGYNLEIAEPFQTFRENAFAKANTIYKFSNKNVFADDSGLCVNALDGLPGVDSAHFSGERNDERNLIKVIELLNLFTDKSAYYKAVICLIWEHEVYYFEGICEGRLINNKRGKGGFGYDPIFIPHGYEQTFGELPLQIKNQISHRAKAVGKMVEFIKQRIEVINLK